jgi:hypothetical protein
MTERRIEVVYCDDVRAELGNKNSLMGVYQGDLFVNAMPIVLPKLCAWVNVVTPRDMPFERLRIMVFQGEAELLDTGDLIDADNPLVLPEIAADAPGDGDAPQLLAANLVITLAPFQIDSESALRVVAETEQGQLISRRLRIRRGKSGGAQPG